MKNNNSYSKYLFLLLFIIIFVIAIFVVKPFIITLLASAIIAYIFYPLYSWLKKKTKLRRISSLITVIIILLIILIPFTLITAKISQESYVVYLRTKQFLNNEKLQGIGCENDTGFFCSFAGTMQEWKSEKGIDVYSYMKNTFTNFTTYMLSMAQDLIFSIPKYAVHLFLLLFTTFFLFLDGKRMLQLIKNILPMKEKHKDEIFNEFNKVIYATVYGTIIISLIQGAVAGVGYAIFGLESPILWALITVVAAFVPFFGTFLIWFPASIKLIITGVAATDGGGIWRGIGLLLWGALLVSTIDNFLKPKIVGDKAGIHPLIVLLGVFGGLALFGFVGVLIGPSLLAIFVSFLKIYEQEKFHLA